MSDTSPGASVNRHVADAVLGNAIVSLRFVLLVSNITSLSNPNAIPPCGGAPYLNASSKKPNCSFACSVETVSYTHLTLPTKA